MRRTQEGYSPFKDDKPKDTENSPFEASSVLVVKATLYGTFFQKYKIFKKFVQPFDYLKSIMNEKINTGGYKDE